jgi:hypothetical protein
MVKNDRQGVNKKKGKNVAEQESCLQHFVSGEG